MTSIQTGSLVLFKRKAARVVSVGDKIDIKIQGVANKSVRLKDIQLIHQGPVNNLENLRLECSNVEEVWELLDGEETDCAGLGELLFNENTAKAAWNAWLLLDEGIYFHGTPDKIKTQSADHIKNQKEEIATKAEAENQWNALIDKIKKGNIQKKDHELLMDVQLLADGRSQQSRILEALGLSQTPEKAHDLLLKLGVWDATHVPFAYRAGFSLKAPKVDISPEMSFEREDLTDMAAFAIDDEDSTDADDAISLHNGWIWVHIADVASFINAGSKADQVAMERVANLYLPDKVVPMLPHEVTEKLALGMDEISPALSIGMLLDENADIIKRRICLSQIKVRKMSYQQAQDELHTNPDLSQIYKISQLIRNRRKNDLASFLQFPEVKVRIKNGEILVKPLPGLDSREMVTDIMLKAGACVAEFAIEHNIPVPFATQPPPEEHQSPVTLSQMFAYRKCMQRSSYKILATPHAGVGLAAYTQVTSPLRRYLDLVVHQQLHAFLSSSPLLDIDQVFERIASVEAINRKIRRVEQQCNRHWILAYLIDNTWQGEGIVVERQGKRATVLIPELGLETKMSLTETYDLDETVHLASGKVDLVNQLVHFQLQA